MDIEGGVHTIFPFPLKEGNLPTYAPNIKAQCMPLYVTKYMSTHTSKTKTKKTIFQPLLGEGLWIRIYAETGTD